MLLCFKRRAALALAVNGAYFCSPPNLGTMFVHPAKLGQWAHPSTLCATWALGNMGTTCILGTWTPYAHLSWAFLQLCTWHFVHWAFCALHTEQWIFCALGTTNTGHWVKQLGTGHCWSDDRVRSGLTFTALKPSPLCSLLLHPTLCTDTLNFAFCTSPCTLYWHITLCSELRTLYSVSTTPTLHFISW